MYIKTVSPDSGRVLYLNVIVEILDYKIFKGEEEAHKYAIDNIKVMETLTLEALAKDIKRILLSTGKIPDDLDEVLIDSFGISKNAIPDLVECMFPFHPHGNSHFFESLPDKDSHHC